MGRRTESELPEWLEEIPSPVSTDRKLSEFQIRQFRHGMACLHAWREENKSRKASAAFKGARNMLVSPLLGHETSDASKRVRLMHLRDALAQGQRILASRKPGMEMPASRGLREAMTAL